MTDNNYQEVIKNNKLFDGIPIEKVKFSFNDENVIRMKEGEIIFQKGDESKFTYLILAGKVKLKIYIENKSIKLTKTATDFFGEIEVLEDTFRRSAAVANTDCILYLMHKNNLRNFLTEIPELNDNIIAYNKVEIPELQISIHPNLLKKETDKIYIHSLQENLNELTRVPLINTEKEEITEDKTQLETSVKEKIDEKIAGGITESFDTTPDASKIKQFTQDIPEVEEKSSVITEEEADEESLPTGEHSADYIQDEQSIIEENLTDLITESEREFLAESDYTAKSVQDVTEENKISPEETEDIPELPEKEPIPTIPHDSDYGDVTDWINLDTKTTEEETPYRVEEKEKERYEAEEEKVKYDDTDLNTKRILQAVMRINSGLTEREVRTNIIREAVKLTEAQAGVLYLVDNIKNLLVTEMESEDGFTDISYPVGLGLTGLAVETGEIINIREPAKDFRYSENVDSIRGIVGSSLLCVPVPNDKKEIIAVICLANSSSGKFLISDEEKILALVPHISQTLQKLIYVKQSGTESEKYHLSTLTKFITENIQTPVLTMKYYASQIKKKNIPADIKTVLNVLMDQADSVVNFLHSSLAFTENKNPLEIKDYDLQEVIDDTLSLLAEYVESRNVNLYKKVEGGVKIKVDKRAFYQACLQIARNACDAMGESGNIYISAKPSGDLINIEFRDTGPGISDDLKQQIFLPFKSFNKENGAGLGLTLAQKIIRDHGGELIVESNPGEGATFIISLPSFEQI